MKTNSLTTTHDTIPRDYHMHTYYSTDSNAPMKSMIRSAIEKGMTEIALTDHVDFDFPGDYTKGEAPFMVDYHQYLQEFLPLREQYSDQINILLGVEIGLQPHLAPQIEKLLSDFPYDFVIGSIHTVNGQDVYLPDFHEGKTQNETYEEYFRYAFDCAKLHSCYDVFGHLDYINRYGKYDTNNLYYEDYRELIDEILLTLISSGKGLEINTSGYRYGLSQTHPQASILKRYHELGGEILTVGSDAHRSQDIGEYFPLVKEMLENIGIRYLTRFDKRMPKQIPLI